MRPVTDKMKISRERLAFIIDATAAPVAGLAIISTWIGLEVGLIGDAFNSIGVNENAFGVDVYKRQVDERRTRDIMNTPLSFTLK